jgi:hypothetical protein
LAQLASLSKLAPPALAAIAERNPGAETDQERRDGDACDDQQHVKTMISAS